MLYSKLANELWMLAVSFLPIKHIIPHLPRVGKYFGETIIWGPMSGALMWREMHVGPDGAPEGQEGQGLDARVFKWWPGENPPGQTALIRACADGAPLAHVATLVAAAGAGVASRAVDGYGWTALWWASDRGHEGMVQTLLEASADPNVADYSGWTPLIAASARGHLAVVAALMANGAQVNHVSRDGRTALMWASQWNDIDVVRLLVANGANVNLTDNEGKTALDIARLCRRREIVPILESAMFEQ